MGIAGRNEPSVVAKAYDLALWILPHIAKMIERHTDMNIPLNKLAT